MSSLPRATTDTATATDRRPSTVLDMPSTELNLRPSNAMLYTSLAHIMEYNSLNPVPADWLSQRHGVPAIFRDTFGTTAWWTSQQQHDIKAAIARWASPTIVHPFHSCSGYVIHASTRSTPAVQRGIRQRHTLDYFVQQLHRTKSSAGIIMYSIDVATHPLTASFRTGPAGLDLHRYDVLHHSGTTALTLIVGMHLTWTRPHVDTAGDSVWQMLVEGEKLWILARPEAKDAMKAQFHDDKTLRWSQLDTDDREWLSDHRCLMVLQKAGDLLYIPKGWPHMCTHLTDTIALNCNLLHSWDFASAMAGLDFNRLAPEEVEQYRTALAVAVSSTTPAGLGWAADEAQATWERKMKEREASAEEQKRREEEAEEQAEPVQESERRGKKRKSKRY